MLGIPTNLILVCKLRTTDFVTSILSPWKGCLRKREDLEEIVKIQYSVSQYLRPHEVNNPFYSRGNSTLGVFDGASEFVLHIFNIKNIIIAFNLRKPFICSCV